ncbi:MAG TPA: hypothetical protein VH333_23500, partial [Pseudonocardiaceae bacterium]|nr:hypothetical protein [Pseudonocardiaceae bacterium]
MAAGGALPYGFDDDEHTRGLLRPRPPADALAWVESVLGGPVVAVRVLRGGMSSAMHLVAVATGERAVLRRYVRFDPTEPDIAPREARALEFVARLPLPTPELLAADVTGTATGVPMLLMS